MGRNSHTIFVFLATGGFFVDALKKTQIRVRLCVENIASDHPYKLQVIKGGKMVVGCKGGDHHRGVSQLRWEGTEGATGATVVGRRFRVI